MAARLKWWLKERDNPQLGIYYVRKGQMTKKAAKAIEDHCLYGFDYMLSFDTEGEYNAKIAELKSQGKSMQ
jgi:hypothetical protein